ncbi:branched-chain amino acid ABC transporter permease [Rhizobium sp. P38BS-XIX]|uniref:branched-chain amino acid ABC transporter permease n=1 Tax=Rhizobium sp. P38BS-XIX TaxID=2726740 RepID=UPI001FF061E6|nr:branched-chain amino acid ABC transporter permease [Rhizobium sp. P38BS-XIX]
MAAPYAQKHIYGWIAFAISLCIAPFFFYPILLMKILCFALFASAFNLMLGFGGLLSFGHAAFFGSASYVSAYLAKEWGLDPALSVLAGTAIATILGAAIGSIAIRREGIYFAMITLALAQLVFFAALQLKFTGGEDGIQSVPRGMLFGFIDLSDNGQMYAFVAVVCFAALLFVQRIAASPFGQVLQAIRDNETRATSLGYRVDRYKLLIFILSATLSGLAGAMKSLVFQLASLTDVHWSTSGEVILMVILGGIGTSSGPVVGAALIVWMQEYLASFGAWVMVLQGMIFVACVLAFRRGIIGTLRDTSSFMSRCLKM